MSDHDDSAQRVVLASNNKGKLRELDAALAPLGWQVEPASMHNLDSPDETGTTFVENAIIKARHAAEVTGLPALADDSGISVPFLGGAPGVYSARYAGADASDEDNLELLLENMADVPAESRAAQFVSVVVFMRSAEDPLPVIATGLWSGTLTTAPRGEHGFGYDPIFEVPGLGKTSAEIDMTEKNKLSHRGQAIKQLLQLLGNA